MTFYVGQKVICVDAKPRLHARRNWIWGDAPTEGAIYTISELYIGKEGLEIVLHEHKRSPYSEYRGFASRRFRPLVSDTRKVSFTEGAPKDSERWDNRKQKVRA